MYIQIITSTLLICQFVTFSILRTTFEVKCIYKVLMYSELFKFLFCFLKTKNVKDIFLKDLHVIIIPLLCFGIMNVSSFWVLTQVPATLYVVFLQMKLPFTMVSSYLMLHKKFTYSQVVSVLFITISCSNILMKNNLKSLYFDNIFVIFLLLLECTLSALGGSYIQLVFDNSIDNMWSFNLKMSFFSTIIYAVLTEYFKCSFQSTTNELILSLICTFGGILVGYMITYNGVVSKTISSSISIIVISVYEHYVKNVKPSFQFVSFVVISLFAVSVYTFESIKSSQNSNAHNFNKTRVTESQSLLVKEENESNIDQTIDQTKSIINSV